jgi:hypothetical protein
MLRCTIFKQKYQACQGRYQAAKLGVSISIKSGTLVLCNNSGQGQKSA